MYFKERGICGFLSKVIFLDFIVYYSFCSMLVYACPSECCRHGDVTSHHVSSSSQNDWDIEHGSVSSFTYSTTSCRSAPCHWRRWDAAFVMLVHSSLGCVDVLVFRTMPDNAINYNTILSVTSLLRHHRHCQCWSAVKSQMWFSLCV